MPFEKQGEEIELLHRATIVEKDSEDSISSIEPCNTTPEHGIEIGEKLVRAEEFVRQWHP